MLPVVVVPRLSLLLLPAVILAHPTQLNDFNDLTPSDPRSLSKPTSHSPNIELVGAPILAREVDDILRDYDSQDIAKRQSLLPIDALNFSSLSPDTFNLTEASPGQFNFQGSDVDESISFDEKIPLPIWPAIYFRVKGELDDQLECTAELWIHVVFNYELITAHGNLKTGLDWNVSTKVIVAMARLYVLTASDGYYHLIFEALGKVYIPRKGWTPFHILKEIWKFKDGDQAAIAVPAASSVATS